MHWLDPWARWLVRRAWLVLLAVGVATTGVGAGIARLEADFSFEASLPAGHPYVAIDAEIRRDFGGRRTMIAAVVPRDGGDVWRTPILEIVREITLDALRLPDVMSHAVVSLAAPSVRYVEDRDGEIRVDYLMREVPRTADEIVALRARLESDPQLRGLLVTPDQRAALVFIDFWDGPPPWELADRVDRMVERHRGRGVDVWLTGEPMFARTDIGQSTLMARRIPITFLVIALMLLLSFRNLQGMAIPMLTATLSCVWALGLMGHTGIVIDSWNVAVPILLIAVAAAHSAQMLKRYVEEVKRLDDNRAAVIASTVAIGPVMIAAGTTATLGFLSLALFGVRSIANLGISCAYGIGSAVLLEMTFIPALRAILPAPRHWPSEGGPTQRLLGLLGDAVLRRRGAPVLWGTLIVLLLAAVGATRIRTFGPTREYTPVGSDARVHLEAIERHFPGTVTMTVLYAGEPGSAKTVSFLKHMAALQEELASDPLVLRTSSLADLVKILHRTFAADLPDPYRVPDDQELLAQLLFLGDSPAFERFTDRAQSKGLLVAYLRDDDSALVGPLVRRTKAWLAAHPPPPGVEVKLAGGMGPIVLAINEHTTWGKILNMIVVLTVIFAVSSLIMRSAAIGGFVVVPIVTTVFLLFGALGWTGTRLDMGSSSVIAMAAGIGADYAIYLVFRLREERHRHGDDAQALRTTLATSGRAILFVAASIGAGFAVVAVSPYLGMRLFGTLMPGAMALASLASLTLLPVLVLRVQPRFLANAASALDTAAASPEPPIVSAPRR